MLLYRRMLLQIAVLFRASQFFVQFVPGRVAIRNLHFHSFMTFEISAYLDPVHDNKT
jgi:hypothetical protein